MSLDIILLKLERSAWIKPETEERLNGFNRTKSPTPA